MTGERPQSYPEEQDKTTYDITPFDSLAIFFEDRIDRSEAELLQAIEVAVRQVFDYPEDEWDTHIGEITGIALENGVEPDIVIGIYKTLSSEVE